MYEHSVTIAFYRYKRRMALYKNKIFGIPWCGFGTSDGHIVRKRVVSDTEFGVKYCLLLGGPLHLKHYNMLFLIPVVYFCVANNSKY